MFRTSIATLVLFASLTTASFAAQPTLDDAIADIGHRWAKVSYQTPEAAREAAFGPLIAHTQQVAQAYPGRAEPMIWEAIVLSSAAKAEGGLGALSKAKAGARPAAGSRENQSQRAERLHLQLARQSLRQGSGMADRIRRQEEGKGLFRKGARHQSRRDRPQLLLCGHARRPGRLCPGGRPSEAGPGRPRPPRARGRRCRSPPGSHAAAGKPSGRSMATSSPANSPPNSAQRWTNTQTGSIRSGAWPSSSPAWAAGCGCIGT